jgi:hypothetical protein
MREAWIHLFEVDNVPVEGSGLSRPAPLWQRTPTGFGKGIELAVAWICELDHVRKTIPFALSLHRIYP